MNITGKNAGTTQRIAAIAIGLTLLAGCGTADTADTGAVDGIETVDVALSTGAATYTISSGDTLSGIASRAEVSLDELVAANGWFDGNDHLILPGDVIHLPAGASGVAPKSASPTNTTNEKAKDTSVAATQPSGGYRPATFEMGVNGDRTDPVTTPLADGLYYSPFVDSNGSTVTFTLGQWFICSDLSTLPDGLDCDGGVDSLTQPSAQVAMASNADIIIATGHKDNQTFSRVNPAEYARITDGYKPAADAPAGFDFHLNIHSLVRVSGGVVVQVQQFYMS